MEVPGDNLPKPAQRPRARIGKWRLPLPLMLLLSILAFALAVWHLGKKHRAEAKLAAEKEAKALRGPSPDMPVDLALIMLDPLEVAAIPTADRWEQPLGSERGAFAYNAQPFLTTRHLGDDLNGIGGWNTDLGDPVYSAARGRVIFAGAAGEGWGNMVIVAHRLPVEKAEEGDLPSGSGRIIQSVYAHLQKVSVHVGDELHRGEKLGTVGSASGKYLAHLHFEIRDSMAPHPGKGYFDTALGRVSPERWIREHSYQEDFLPPAPEALPSQRSQMQINIEE